MEKAKVKRSFVDKETRETYNTRDNNIWKGTEERKKELIAIGVLEKDEEIQELEEKEPEELKVAEIKALLEEKGIEYPAKATKPQLKALLEGAE